MLNWHLTITVVIDQPEFIANGLPKPDAGVVGPAKIKEGVYWLCFIIWHAPYPSFFLCQSKLLRINRSVQRYLTIPFPYVLVSIRVARFQFILFPSQGLRKPWVVIPIDFYYDSANRGIDYKPLMSLIGFQFRVVSHPDFRPLFTNS